MIMRRNESGLFSDMAVFTYSTRGGHVLLVMPGHCRGRIGVNKVGEYMYVIDMSGINVEGWRGRKQQKRFVGSQSA